MRIIFKAKNFVIDEETRKYIEKKLRKYNKILEEPAVIEVRLEDEFGLRNGSDKLVHIFYTLPKEKNPFHISARTNNFRGSIDLAQKKFEREIMRYKALKKMGLRFPTKYHAAELEEKFERENN